MMNFQFRRCHVVSEITLFGGLLIGVFWALRAASGEPAKELNSRPIQGKVKFTLKGNYENPVFTMDGKQLIFSKSSKFSGVDEEGKPKEYPVDEIWKVDLVKGKKQLLIRATEFKGRIGAQAMLIAAELEDAGHLRLAFKDAEIGDLRYTIDLTRFTFKRWYKDSDNAPGHDEPRLSPEEEKAKPAIDQCFPDEELWSLFVVPEISAYILRRGANGKTQIIQCDLVTHKFITALSLPDGTDDDFLGGARTNGRVLVGVRQAGHLNLFSGSAPKSDLLPAGEITGPADFFTMRPLPNENGTLVISKWGNWKVIESELYRFDGKALTRITGLAGLKNADISPDGKNLAVAIHDDKGDRIEVYQLLSPWRQRANVSTPSATH